MTVERIIPEPYRLYEVPHPAKVLAQKLIPGTEVLPFQKEPEEKPTWEAPKYIPETHL